MTDEFVRQLQNEWRAQPVGKAALVERLRRGRWTPHAVVWLEVLQGVVGVAFGFVFVWLAIDDARLAVVFAPVLELRAMLAEQAAAYVRTLRVLFAVAGVVMFAAVPPLAWAAVRARRGSLKWEDETPESVLRVGLRRADASLRANRIGRWHVFLLLAFVAGLWALPLLGLMPVFVMVFMTVAYAFTIAPIWLWLDMRRERLRRELETYVRLLDDYEGDGVI
jgi:hypothetical protein